MPDVILFNFPLFVHFMFISKVFKLQFRLQSPFPSEARYHRQRRKSLIGRGLGLGADDSSSQDLMPTLDWSSKDKQEPSLEVKLLTVIRIHLSSCRLQGLLIITGWKQEIVVSI